MVFRERVFNWQRGLDSRKIPESPPRSIFRTHRLVDRELEHALVGVHAVDLQVRTKVRYREFVRSSLLGRLPLLASSTAGVSILAF